MRISFILMLLGLTLYLAVSDTLLSMVGIPYTASFGSFIYKLHPATYFCLLSMLFAIFSNGNALRQPAQVWQNVSYGLYCMVVCMLMVYTTYRYGMSGSAFLIDTLLMPAIVGLTLNLYPDTWRATLFKVILSICLANALISIVEAATQWRLEEYAVSGGTLIVDDQFRATALMGHPLGNAMVMSVAAFGMTVWCRHWLLRTMAVFVFLLSLLAFGGRTAFLLTGFLVFLGAVYSVYVAARRGRIRARHLLTCLILFGILCAILGAAVFWLDLGQRIFDGFVWDDSADVRRRSLMAFDFLSPEQILLGISPWEIDQVILRINVRNPIVVIENTWVVLSLQFGLIGLVMFAACYGFLLVQLVRGAPLAMKVGLLSFLILTSSNNALSAKTMVLVFVVSLIATSKSFVKLRARNRFLQRVRRRPDNEDRAGSPALLDSELESPGIPRGLRRRLS